MKLRELGLLSLEKRKLRGNLIAKLKNLIKSYKEDDARLLSEVHRDRTGGKQHKWKHEKVSYLGSGHRISVMVVKASNR